MNIVLELEKGITKKNNGVIDAIILISKIEALRDKSFNFNFIKNTVNTYYKDNFTSDETKIIFKVLKLPLTKYYSFKELPPDDNIPYDEFLLNRLYTIYQLSLPYKYKIQFSRIIKYYLMVISKNKEVINLAKKKNFYFKTLFGISLFFTGLLAASLLFFLFNDYFNVSTPRNLINKEALIITFEWLLPFSLGGLLLSFCKSRKLIFYYLPLILLLTFNYPYYVDVIKPINQFKYKEISFTNFEPSDYKNYVIAKDNSNNEYILSKQFDYELNKTYQSKISFNNVILDLYEEATN
ncbi:MAG: hypothetical protein ACOCRX_00770 [Candidatus Woesearchaeota archaeon]